MALAIDGSSPAVATASPGPTVTTASFTPPAGALLLVAFSGDSAAGANPSAPTVTDNLGVHLTYTLVAWQSRADAPTADGQAAMWWAVVGSSAAMTVSVTNNAASSRECALKVWVLTGANTSGIGASGKSGSASAASIAQSYTAQATSAWGFIVDCDWDLKGAQTAGTGCTVDGSANLGTAITYGFGRRTTADDSNGVSNTLNVTLPATSTNLSWVYAEIKPAVSGASFDAQVSVTRQQSSVTRVCPVVIAPTIGPPQVIQLPQITVVRHVKQPPAPFPIAVNPPLLPAQAQPVAPICVVPQARLAQPPTISVSQPQVPAAVAGILPSAAAVVAQQFRPATAAPIVIAPVLLPSGQPEPSAPVWVNPSQTQPFLAAVTSITPPPLPQPPAPITVIPSRSQPPLSATITLTPSPLPPTTAPIVVVTSTWQPRQPQIVVSQPQLPAVVAILPAAPILVAAAFVRPGFLPTTVSPPQFLGAAVLPTAPIVVAPTFTQFRLAPVFVAAGTATAHLCVTPRPGAGTTTRPGSGITAYNTATTSRPNTGVTARPNTGTTQDPC